MSEFFPVFVFLCISTLLSLLILGLSFVFSVQKPDPEKLSAYECGFDPFGDARERFQVQFYLVAILFIIFDLEITYLFPWAVVLKEIHFFGFLTIVIFLLVLTLGFFYEWRKGALTW
jgi:NADH:ubiquinone oxidoreductase subunit 3 (subunit A)